MTAELRPEGAVTRVDGFASLGLGAGRVVDGIRLFVRSGGFTGYRPTARFAAVAAPRKTRRRRDLMADGEWYGSAHYEEWHRPCGRV